MENLLAALRAVGEETRLRILGLLAHEELTVSELTLILDQSQPRVSRHLKLLIGAGLLTRSQEGTWAFFRLVDEGDLADLVQSIVDRIPAEDVQHIADLNRLSDIRQTRAKEAKDYFASVADNWSDIRKLHVPEEQVEAILLEACAGRNIENLLDVGTGTARMLELFSDQIERGTGIDLSQEMLAVARATLTEKGLRNCQARLGDMYNIPLASDSQDVVLVHQVLHFADQPDSAIREAARVLRPGGRLLIVDFAPHNNETLRTDHAHRRLGFSDRDMANWCHAAGLDGVGVHHLDEGELTVCIWVYDRPSAVVQLVEPARVEDRS